MRSSILLLTATLVPQAGGIAERLPAGDQVRAADRWTLPAGQVYPGDLYAFARELHIDGEVAGDLLGCAGNIVVNGPVAGDLFAAASNVRLEGPIGDSTRVVAGTVLISDRIDGDLLVVSGDVTLSRESHVTGNVIVYAGKIDMAGTIDGDLLFTGGEIALRGQVGRDLELEADTVRLESGARVGGDVRYESRRELVRADDVTIGGAVHYQPTAEEEEEEGEEGGGGFWWLVRIWLFLGALLIGVVVMSVARRGAPLLIAQLGREPMLSALVGFGTSLIVPAAAMIAIGLIAPALLGLFALAVFCLVVYLAKLPVALWLGTRGARLLGFDAPPALAVAAGLAVLYPLFWLPCLGSLVWLITAWLGLGSLILAARTKLQARPAP